MPAHAMTEQRRGPVLQTLAALAVGAYAADGARRALAPLAQGTPVRGLLLLVVLLIGGGLALWAPYRLRGWRAALAGSLVISVGLAAIHLADTGIPIDVLQGIQVLAAGFTIGGVVAAAGAAQVRERALVTGGLAGGLLFGAQLYVLPFVVLTSDFGVAAGGWYLKSEAVLQYLAAGFAVLGSALAVVRVAPSGQVNLTAAPLVVLVVAVLVATAVLGGTPGLVLVWLLVPVLIGAAAWWLTPAALMRSRL